MSGLRVAVAGGGLGGLCLAQGLLKAGVDVTVYERDAQLAGRRQGYRLHVDARAGLALEQCLPPGSLALFQATCSEASTRLTVVSERLRVLNEQRRTGSADPYAPATLSTSVNRQTLREVLAAGLDGRLVFGCELTGYELTSGRHGRDNQDGRDGVRLHFARIRTSPPVPPWPPSRVTVLGDAIHAMSPARGSGANTALQDAALLCRTLTGTDRNAGRTGPAGSATLRAGSGAARNGGDLIAAVGEYERQMRDYGYTAVAASRAAEAETGARHNRLMFWLYRRMTGARA